MTNLALYDIFNTIKNIFDNKRSVISVDRIGEMIERRRFQRVGTSLPLHYKNLKKFGDTPSGSLTRDLSEGGVCFKSSEFISLACRLVVEINLPTIHRPIKAISKVAWIRKLPAGDSYELGNQFLEMTKEDKTLIKDFVNKVLEKSI